MYCKMCGNKLGDADRYCQFCGAPTGIKEPPAVPEEKIEVKEEVVFNPPYENKSRFTEEPERTEEPAAPEKEKDLKELISDQEIEAAQKTQDDAGAEPGPVKNSEFTWNVYEFPTEKKKTEDIEFNWSTGEPVQPEPKDAEKDAETVVFEEELFQEIREDSSRIRDQNIDRFFTFSRKNEEFQELLDREYDKIKSRSEPVPIREIHTKADAEPETETEQVEIIEPEKEEPPAEEIPVVTDIPEPEEEQPEPIEESTESVAEPAEPIEEQAEPVEVYAEPEEPETAEQMEDEPEPAEEEPPAEKPVEEPAEPQEAPKTEHLSEMARARAQYFGDELVKDNESIRKSLEPSEISEPPEIPKSPEMAASPEAAEQKSEEEPHKRSVGQIVLSIIAVILVIEIVILGIRYFAPDSDAAKAIVRMEARISNAVMGITDSVGGWFATDDSKDNTTPPEDDEKNAASSGAIGDDQSAGQKQTDNGTAVQTPPALDPNPMSDKDALVTSQLGNNSNIQQVKANTALAYVPGKNYGLSDINNSTPITNNIWQAPEGGDPVYYDKSVVGTVIAFDSQWIDYVNGSSKSVLDLLKKDSKAYQQTLTYSKVGKVKETFKLLEIGEIRQGAKGFYVWAHEAIQKVESGKTSDIKYNYIYYLEPSDGKMQIVNYFKF